MVATARKNERATGASGHEPERTCIVSRAKLAPEDLIRFVRGPDGTIVPDLSCRLPGRGVWVACRRLSVAEAVQKNAFAKALRTSVKVQEDLADRVEDLLKERATGALGFANKAGALKAGFTKVEIAIAKGEVFALIHASDAAQDGRSKLDAKFRSMLAELQPQTQCQIVADLTADELSLAMGRSHVVHAALTKGGAAISFLREAGRLRRYRTNWNVEAALPHEPGSDTVQA